MDDVLPLTIYCAAMCTGMKRAATCHAMMEDLVSVLDESMSTNFEQKLLCNFECAVRYVAVEWINE